MSILSLEAKICADKICAIETGDVPTEHDGPEYLSSEDNGSTLEIEIPLVPLSHVQRNEMYVETFLQPTEVIYPQLCRLDSTYLTWAILGHPVFLNYEDFGAYWIKITAKNPDMCGFEGAKIIGEFAGVIKIYTPESIGGEIPTDGSDPLDMDLTFDNTNNPQIQGDPMVVPGERISLWWKASTNDEYEEVAYDYIHTCCLTGGRIISLSRVCDDAPTYSVRIEGTIYNGVSSSDFREYSEGEWVYILKPASSGCSSCDRTSGCKGESYDGGGIIVPLHITGVSP